MLLVLILRLLLHTVLRLWDSGAKSPSTAACRPDERKNGFQPRLQCQYHLFQQAIYCSTLKHLVLPDSASDHVMVSLFAARPEICVSIHTGQRGLLRNDFVGEHVHNIMPDGESGTMRRFYDVVYDVVCAFGCLVGLAHVLQPCDESADAGD
jgi:hypothetical protein